MDYSLDEGIFDQFFAKAKDLIIPSESNNYKSRFLQSNILLYCVVLLLVLKIFITLIPLNLPKNIFFADITKSTLEAFVNQSRQSMGLSILTENSKLNQAAEAKAENMVQNNYFDHTSPSGTSPWFWFIQAGYKYKYAGENLAIGFYDSSEVYNAWLNSPSHRANILNPNYTEVGTAVVKGFGQNNSIVVVQEFGTQLPVKPVVAKNNTKPVVVKPATNVQVETPAKTPAETPVETPAVITQPIREGEKVLSQTIESKDYFQAPTSKTVNNLSSKILSSVIYDYDDFIQNIIYAISLLIIGILMTLIFFNININFHKQLVYRAISIVAILSVATLLNKEIIISLIPHQIII